MQCLWPHIEKAACKWAWENLDELLNSNDFWRPKWLHTSGVKLQGIILGHVPPTVTGMWPSVVRTGSACKLSVRLWLWLWWWSLTGG